MPPAPTPAPVPSSIQTPAPAPQRGNPKGIRAKATDHAVRRFAERAIGVVVDEAVDDTAAIVELAHRGVNVRRVRKTLGELGGLGVANGAQAVIVNGLKLVIRDRCVVTVLAKNQTREPSAQPARVTCVLHADFS
ncbi:hypothetical protein ACLBX9_15885 [Methylobacterium sp. A49B]